MKSALAALALALSAVPALAHDVYPGCAIPGAPAATASTWWVDPVNGKSPAAGGDGSQANPWNSLAGIVNANWTNVAAAPLVPGYTRPLLATQQYYHSVVGLGRVDIADAIGAPPVHPGDTIMLMTGPYGDFNVGSYAMQMANSDWITIEAAPGQTPVFTTINIGHSNKWLFNGIKVQSQWGVNGNRLGLINVSDGTAPFPTADIVFENMDVSSVDDISTWTKPMLVAQERIGVRFIGSPGDGTNGVPYTSCLSMTGSHIHNVKDGVNLNANSTLFANNEIDHFSDDGLTYGANNLLIAHNYLHDNQDNGDGNHEDGMQGQIGPLARNVAYNAFSNIVIDSNRIIRQTDPNLQFPQYLQGIDAFDSDWTNMTVTNNVVVTSSCYSFELSSLHDSLVAGNTGLEDGMFPSPGCTAATIVGGRTHEGLDSSNVRITNNLGEHFAINDQGEPTVTFDHNFALNAYQPFVHWSGTGFTFAYPAGTDANGNFAPKVSIPYASVFKTWSPTTGAYDLHILPTSPTVTPGPAMVPPTYIDGLPRGSTTPGAYPL